MNRIGFDPRLPTVSFSLEYLRILTARLTEVFRGIAAAVNSAADGFTFRSSSQTGNYTVQLTDQIILVKNTANCTITLPSAKDVVDKRFVVKKAINNAFTVTVVASSGNIDDAASQIITAAYTSIDMVSDGTNYWII